jgi:hypothetical protein
MKYNVAVREYENGIELDEVTIGIFDSEIESKQFLFQDVTITVTDENGIEHEITGRLVEIFD